MNRFEARWTAAQLLMGVSTLLLGCSAGGDAGPLESDDAGTGGTAELSEETEVTQPGPVVPPTSMTETPGSGGAPSVMDPTDAPSAGGSMMTAAGGTPAASGGSSSASGGETSAPSTDAICSSGVCCPASCGACGGSGCGDRPGGSSECCTGTIDRSGVYCEGEPNRNAPCIEGTAPDDEEPWDGGVCVEVESASPVGDWSEESSKPGYSGSGYHFWTGDTSFSDPSGAVLTYTFNIEEAGTYRLALRGRRDHEGVCAGAEEDRCNDVWTRMDGGQWRKTMIRKPWGTWDWDDRYECGHKMLCDHDVSLSAGQHTFRIDARSLGTKLDAFRLYPADVTAPETCEGGR